MPVGCTLSGVGAVDPVVNDERDVPVVELASIDCRNGFVDCCCDTSVVPVWKGCCGEGVKLGVPDCGIEERVGLNRGPCVACGE